MNHTIDASFRFKKRLRFWLFVSDRSLVILIFKVYFHYLFRTVCNRPLTGQFLFSCIKKEYDLFFFF